MLKDYLHIALFFVIGITFGMVILAVASIARTKGSGKKDLSAYECGMDPVGPAWVSPNIRFYVFALLFVVFDVEALFIFPWAVRFRELGVAGFVEVVVFASILFIGLVYAWRKGALEWEK